MLYMSSKTIYGVNELQNDAHLLFVYLFNIQNKSILQSKHQQWQKISPLKAFMAMHRMASIKSISAHMHSPWGVIRDI